VEKDVVLDRRGGDDWTSGILNINTGHAAESREYVVVYQYIGYRVAPGLSTDPNATCCGVVGRRREKVVPHVHVTAGIQVVPVAIERGVRQTVKGVVVNLIIAATLLNPVLMIGRRAQSSRGPGYHIVV